MTKSETANGKPDGWRVRILTMLFFSVVTGTVALSAQVNAQLLPTDSLQPPAYDETVNVKAGDVLEILPVLDPGSWNYAWILTKDGQFVLAGRDKIFRTRQATPGDYQLDSAIQDPDSGVQYRRRFLVHVQERPLLTDLPTPLPGWIVQTLPPMVQETVTLPEQTELLTLVPNTEQSVHFGVKLDVDRTATGTSLGTDNADSFAYNDIAPLTLWFPAPGPRVLEVSLQKQDGTIASERIALTLGTEAEPIATGGGIVNMVQADGSILFLLEQQPTDGAFITEWDFGDGVKSLRTSPSHRYAKGGVYHVSVDVRYLKDAKLAVHQETVLTVSMPNPSSGMSSSSAGNTSGSGAVKNGWSFGSVGAIFASPLWKIGFFVLLAIGLLGLLLVLIGKLLNRPGGSLQERLAKAEEQIVPTSIVTEDVALPPPPMELRRGAQNATKDEEKASQIDEEIREEETAGSSEPASEPVIDLSTAPAWLKKGIAASPPPPKEEIQDAEVVETPAVTEPMPPAPVQTIPEPVAEPKPIVSEPQPAATKPIAETPVITGPKEEAPAPAPAPAPVSAPTTDDAAEAREREKKRLKRLRYRENLKRRKKEEKQSEKPNPIVSPPASTSQEKLKTEPLIPAPKKAAELPAAPVEASLPPPPSETLLQKPQEIPEVKANEISDEEIAFVVRADAVSDDAPPKTDEPQS